ncbi:MAG: hypothetical protein EHM35_11190, partial [Planctomycetaceae bacterium]
MGERNSVASSRGGVPSSETANPAARPTLPSLLIDAIPAILVAVLLALPSLRLGYFWDDFTFLTRVQSDPIGALGHFPGSLFYRPISQGLYFWPLVFLGESGPVVANLLNVSLLAAAICLLVTLSTRLGGTNAGLIAGLAYACLAPISGLVGWASGAQDLLAIVFTLAALHLRDSGRNLAAAAAAVIGLLCKETAVLVIPVLILWDAIVGNRSARVGFYGLCYGGLALAWAASHPGIRELVSKAFVGEPYAHVGFKNVALFEHQTTRYLLTLVNVPITGAETPWPMERTGYGVAALALALGSLWLRSSVTRPPTTLMKGPPLSLHRVALLADLIVIPGILLQALLLNRWAAYFVCLPAVGTSLLIGVLFARVPLALASLGVIICMGLGIWCHGIGVSGGGILTERSFAEASRAIRDVERGFRKLRPTLPRGSQVLASVAASGPLGIHQTIHDGQALRIWYGDPTIRTLRPERRLAGPPAEFLFRITSSREVVEIDPDRGTYRSSGGNPSP